MANRSKQGGATASRPSTPRCFRPSVELLEDRRLLAASGFLQGTAFVDLNTNNKLDPGEPLLAGATVQLFSADGSTLLNQTTTDANGYYLFNGLAPGTYQLKETPPTGFANQGVQALSQLCPATVLSPSTVQVMVVDPTSVTFISTGAFDGASYKIFNTTKSSPAGQLNISVQGPGFSSGPFLSFCVDLLHDLGKTNVTFPVLALPITDLPANGPRIAYLYNHFGTTPLSNDQAGGLALAIWTLEYGSNFQYLGPVPPGFNDAAELAARDMFLSESVGKSEAAVFLDNTQGGMTIPTTGSQGMIATCSMNFGNVPLSTISGQKFEDVNGDGMKEQGEPGLQGFTIFLDTNNNGMLDQGEPSTVTDANGNFTFANLAPGTYRVREVQQAGFVQTTAPLPDIVISQAGTTITGQDIGNFQLATITGQKFEDTNGNGMKDPGEPGLQGFTIFLDTNNNGMLDQGEPSTTTDANGNFSFTNLPLGTYRVREVQQQGFIQTTTPLGDLSVTQSGQVFTGQDIGNFKLATISGQKFEDTNGNGMKDPGEPGLQGFTVFLDTNNNGMLDQGEQSTTTDANGNFSFTNLPLGTYRVREVQQQGFVQTTTLLADIVVSQSGQVFTGRDIGNFKLATISGQKFLDTNGNGIKEQGEPGLQGFTIFLDTNNNGMLDQGEPSTTTDANGNFTFTNLPLGTYRVREVQQQGFTQTTTVLADVVVSQSGQVFTGRDIGNFKLATISGQKFLDLNGNGKKDSGDSGLQGFTIFLDTNNNGMLDQGEQSTTTDANGNFSFTNLPLGTYRVREVQQQGFTQTTTLLADIVVSQSGQVFTGRDIGNFKLATISGQKFLDTNGNGIKEQGEPGLQGFTIFLDTNNNGMLDQGEPSTTTDANGNFTFTNLPLGTYRVREVQQQGFVQTTTPLGDLNVTQSGQVFTGQDIGNFKLATISGQKFEDTNGNGVKESGEPGLQGFTIFLDTNGNGMLDQGEPSTTTDANGNFSFTNLPLGTYRVREVQQQGFIQTTTPLGDISVTQSGQVFTGQDIGNFKLISISGQKFQDNNGNGMKDAGDPGLPGITIFLDLNHDGQLDNNEPSTVTDSNGNFTFTGLGPGTYSVREVQPTGFIRTTPNPADIVATSGQNITGILFGNQPTAALSPFIPTFPMTPQTGPAMGMISKTELFSSNLLGVNGSLTAQAAFVVGVYQNVLNRVPDLAGLVGWVGGLQSGALSRQDVVNGIWSSAEHRGIEVDHFYATFLHRSADAGGRAFFVNEMLNGASEEQVVQQFLVSGEYNAAHATNLAYVTGMYTDVLGRSPDSAGLAIWLQMLQNGTSRAAVAQAFVNSGEARKDVIDSYYINFLHRQADAGGEQTWLNLLQSGQATLGSVAEAILGSQEYFAQFAKM